MASIERAGAARRAADQAGAPGPGGPSPDTARRLWFKRYPAAQTAATFALALLATAALSIDPSNATYEAIQKIDPTATGALYICYEVLLSFAGHEQAVMLLALAILLTLGGGFSAPRSCCRPRPSRRAWSSARATTSPTAPSWRSGGSAAASSP